MSSKTQVFIFSLFISALVIGMGRSGIAQNEKPQKDFSIFPKYTDIVIEKGKEIEIEVKIVNTGKEEEEVVLSVIPEKKAKDWNARLETQWNRMKIRSLYLFPEEPDNAVTVKFRADPPESAKEEDYNFTLKGTTKDKRVQKSVGITIGLKAKAKEPPKKVSEEIKLLTKYPSVKNPAGKNFEFEIEVKNNADKSRVMNLGIKLPYGWRAYCSPRWEKEKRISAIKVDANSSERLLLTLIPPTNISEGDYPVTFAVVSEKERANIELKTTVTGTYKLEMSTEKGRLNLDTIAGKEKHIDLYLWNEGSAPIEDISFFSNKPEEWEVSFKPDKLSSLPSYEEAQKPEKVDMLVKPSLRTLPGDYMVTVSAAGKQDQKQIDLRTTVKVSTKWGWVGVIIIIVVIGSLMGIFIRLKRR
ncbi:MAG: NEW3 domain-containing protein [Candidatus Aerophobetes bacterium]|nr:NEW3 domain-containing protein [Candidatus Aerophobetes bacterium]